MDTIILTIEPDRVTVRRPSPTGESILVDSAVDISPGESWQGIAYEDLRLLGPGQHVVKTIV